MVSKVPDKSKGSADAVTSGGGGEKSAEKPQEDEARDPVRDEFEQLGLELNMDSETQEEAWRSYESIRIKYTLEGNQLHWLACSLYVACRNSNLPTVGGNLDASVEGNGVSLTRLLRSCKLSLIQFFNKVKKWADMCNLKIEFRHRIDRLERNFAVSNVIFKKYQPIFFDLFRDPAKDAPKLARSRKQKKVPCTPGDVFDFCWCLFIRVKGDFPAISDDLVNSYHLLLSCVDYIYANAYVADRKDLLNDKVIVDPPSKASELQHQATTAAAAKSSDGGHRKVAVPCILDRLCRTHDGIVSEVKSIREHYWKLHIKKFFDDQLLKGEGDHKDELMGILETANFETNAKMIRKNYESYVLSVGEYDERIFLEDDATEEIGTPAKIGAAAQDRTVGETVGDRRPLRSQRNIAAVQFDSSALIPTTPLSGKHYLKAKEQLRVTPVSTATYLVSRLNSLLGKRGPEPSQKLKELLSSFELSDPSLAIATRVKTLGDLFCRHYVVSTAAAAAAAAAASATPHTEGGNEPPKSLQQQQDTFAGIRLRMGATLYYKLLETILFTEKAKNKPLGNLLDQDLFHQALFACCLEIVIFSYNSQRTFPWILNTFGLEAIHFYKVIEVIIRAEDWLPRDVVKHLQRIEEQVLESRAWISNSPLWDALEKDGHGVPSCEEVSLPEPGVGGGHPGSGGCSYDSSTSIDPNQSPGSHHHKAFTVIKSPNATDRFKSPVVSAVARRQLAFEVGSGGGSNPASPVKTVGQQQVVLMGSPHKSMGFSVVSSSTGHKLTSSPVSAQTAGITTTTTTTNTAGSDGVLQQPEGQKPKRMGSLCLFFRKVYHLAHLRLDLLCHTLDIPEDVKRKIWTTFEHTLRNHTDLMKDRHLDQLLMCSLYIVCKVVGQNKNFADIMKHYRNQPQAASHVYRSVLLRKNPPAAKPDQGPEGEQAGAKTGVTPPTPTRLAATSTVAEDGEERGDLINFYNNVFMEQLQKFSLKFKRSRPGDAPPLSPLPKLRAHPQSPCRKLSDNHSVFIRPLKTTPHDVVKYNPHSPHKLLTYSFSRSPAKDLVKINALMRTEKQSSSSVLVVGKRLLADDLDQEAAAASAQPAAKVIRLAGAAPGAVNTKLGLVLGDRAQAE